MAPELLNTLDATELRDLAARVREYQELRGLSDNGLFKKFGGLGSTTTYKKILNNKLEELDLERQLANYRSVVALIENIREDDKEEEIFDDLVPALELRRSYMETSGQSSIARLILVEGDTGSGKTFACKALVRKFGSRFVWAEASEAWGDKPNALLAGILRGMGEREMPVNQNDRLETVVARLNGSHVAIVIDEAHHLGPRSLNTIKTLINRTPGEFILAAMRTLWNRLERDSYQEVKQLTGNRLAERIKLSLRETDVKKLLDRRLEGLSGETKKAVDLLMQHCPRMGNLAFVRNVVRRARDMADDQPVGLEIFSAALKAEIERR